MNLTEGRFTLFLYSSKLYKNINMEREYVVPQIEVLQLQSEGLLCASNEMLGENDGEW